MDINRDELRGVMQIVRVLADEVTATETALQRAQTMVAEAEAETERFKGLDKSIAEWRKHALREGSDPRELPAELAAQRTAKLSAEEELTLARATAAELAGDLETLRSKLSRAKESQTNAAMGVLNAHGDQLANELIELNTRADELRCLLQSLPGVVVFNGRGIIQWRSTERAAWALSGYTSGRAFPGLVDPIKATSERWKARFAALIADPDAVIDDIQAVNPEDVSFRDGSPVIAEG